ncbi:outer membrane protein [Helicobacter pylori]|uniref:outer membrane protein n=1 Tax=Helicobacter pylori TaxID=210 RepID=UPI00165B25B6|nr:outer membrane protein [Helicobacter pylori]
MSVSEKSLAVQTLNYVNEQYPYSWMKTDSVKEIIRNAENALNSKKIATRHTENIGALMADFSFGYKYFLGKKKAIGFRHALFLSGEFGLNDSSDSSPFSSKLSLNHPNVKVNAFILPYGFTTDLLINWINDKLDREYGAKNRAPLADFIGGSGSMLTAAMRSIPEGRVALRSSGLVIGMELGASTWFSSSNFNLFGQIKNRTIFQLSGKFGVRWNTEEYIDYGDHRTFVRGFGVELGVKVPAFNVNYYRDGDGNQLEYKRMVSAYLNVTYNFKNKD